jgi:hypothetical protein
LLLLLPLLWTQVADEFVRFLFTTPAQREFAKLGFRVNPRVSRVAADQQVHEGHGGGQPMGGGQRRKEGQGDVQWPR